MACGLHVMIAALARTLMRRACHHTLIFHRIVRQTDPMSPTEPDQAWFRRLVTMLVRRFDVISLSEAITRLDDGRLHGPTLSITFDDGYADNYEVALPVLEECRAPATFFVASGFVGGGRMWNDSIIETFRRLPSGSWHSPEEGFSFDLNDWASRRDGASKVITAWKHLPPEIRQAKVDKLSEGVSNLPTDLMLSRSQLHALAQSPVATIGGHTRTHPILAAITAAEAKREIEGGRSDLQDWLQQEITLFTYPNGKRGGIIWAVTPRSYARPASGRRWRLIGACWRRREIVMRYPVSPPGTETWIGFHSTCCAATTAGSERFRSARSGLVALGGEPQLQHGQNPDEFTVIAGVVVPMQAQDFINEPGAYITAPAHA